MFINANQTIQFHTWNDSIQLYGIQVTNKQPQFIYLDNDQLAVWFNKDIVINSPAVETFLLHIFFKMSIFML